MTRGSSLNSNGCASSEDGPEDKNSKTRRAVEHPDQQSGILIVEDDFLIAMQAEAALQEAGFDVTGIAISAEEALTMARERRPGLVIMDIHLAGRRDGVEAAGDLFLELGLRCVFATAHDDQLIRSRAEPFAPLGWLSKPYTMASLVGLVRQTLVSRT